MYLTPTKETYDALDRAFHYFNERLFDNRLPAPMILLQRKRGAHGYFWAEQFTNRDETERLDEIALNPSTMGRTVPEVLSTLVHEMTHLEQHHFGTPGKGGNHNKEWGTLMDRVGLEPTSTGQPGGKRTGRKVTHMITPGGPFDAACSDLLKGGFSLPWFTQDRAGAKAKKKTDLSKVKHTCPSCQANAWGKQGINLHCGDCDEQMVSALDGDDA
jgi:hypothetical protein